MVLILVVMEEGQRQFSDMRIDDVINVLILVVMEEGQRLPRVDISARRCRFVLILVVMEEGQRHTSARKLLHNLTRLNPCCNGRGSKTYAVEGRDALKRES